jgi:hypothetical protein
VKHPTGVASTAQPYSGWLQFWSTPVGTELKDGLRENPSYIAFDL